MKPYTYLSRVNKNNNNKKNEKMTKQEFLDKSPEGYEEFLTQEMLLGLNKTQLGNVKRAIGLLMKIAYKTQLKQLSLQQVSDCIDIVEVYNSEQNG